ncbi:hypothetical protein BDV98DRAFT_558523 [Pterulicium gracile]|uniref:Uncharacterized protein n=1 Tax=Pterulicium gracile TaxID=1884261 RepID=A0A5C3R8L9_9AGAR|nr:hypothetical protein BDV98DRAFT_558523 [Pterula gracilis]
MHLAHPLLRTFHAHPHISPPRLAICARPLSFSFSTVLSLLCLRADTTFVCSLLPLSRYGTTGRFLFLSTFSSYHHVLYLSLASGDTLALLIPGYFLLVYFLP